MEIDNTYEKYKIHDSSQNLHSRIDLSLFFHTDDQKVESFDDKKRCGKCRGKGGRQVFRSVKRFGYVAMEKRMAPEKRIDKARGGTPY